MVGVVMGVVRLAASSARLHASRECADGAANTALALKDLMTRTRGFFAFGGSTSVFVSLKCTIGFSPL
jgi:hypothetical protein